MSKIVFKQSYKARASPSTPGLNVRHLNYIATRPGAVYNKGCGFGLWGQLPGDDAVRVLNDLNRAKRIVREASHSHTLYRAIISVGKDDAQKQGLYDRSKWETLVNDHIGVIAKEMGIKPKNLCWCASMHYAKNHPHAHILYWDNGSDPQPEGMSKERFIQKAERIRADLSRDIHLEEILAVQQEQKDQVKQLRAIVQSMCREANPERALDLNRLFKGDQLEGLSQQLFALIRDLPTRGSLRYAYLPEDYKEQLNALIKACLEVPDLAKAFSEYERCTRRVSELYSNSEERTAQILEDARKKLYKELGNEVMSVVREAKEELLCTPPSSQSEVRELIQTAVRDVVPALESYQRLKELLPAERVPVRYMENQIPGFHDQMNALMSDVLKDSRIRLRLQNYALNAALPKDRVEPKKSEHTVCGKKLTEEEWQSYQDVYKEVKRELRGEIRELLRQDAGWSAEAASTYTVGLLCSMMRLLSQASAQKQAGLTQAAQARRLISKDKSLEARKDQRTIQRSSSDWEYSY